MTFPIAAISTLALVSGARDSKKDPDARCAGCRPQRDRGADQGRHARRRVEGDRAWSDSSTKPRPCARDARAIVSRREREARRGRRRDSAEQRARSGPVGARRQGPCRKARVCHEGNRRDLRGSCLAQREDVRNCSRRQREARQAVAEPLIRRAQGARARRAGDGSLGCRQFCYQRRILLARRPATHDATLRAERLAARGRAEGPRVSTVQFPPGTALTTAADSMRCICHWRWRNEIG